MGSSQPNSRNHCSPHGQSPFLGLPREIRDNVYGHLLSIDRGTECIHPRADRLAGEQILGVLAVSQQVRREALEVLGRTNIWISFTVDQSDCRSWHQLRQTIDEIVEDGCKVQPSRLRCGIGALRVLKDKAALAITIRPSSNGSRYTTEDDEHSLTTTTVFAYSKHLFGRFCVLLLGHAQIFENITISFDTNPAVSNKSSLVDIAESMRIIRDYRTVTIRGLQSKKMYRRLRKTITRITWHQSQISALVGGLKLQGNEAFHAQNYPLAIHLYGTGIGVWLNMVRAAQVSSMPIEGTGAWLLGNLYVVLNSNLALSTNKLVASRREVGSSRIVGIHEQQLEIAVRAAREAMDGPPTCFNEQFGSRLPTGKQRVKGCYLGAVALLNKADYEEQISGKFCRESRDYLRAATKTFKLARDRSSSPAFCRKVTTEMLRIEHRLWSFPDSEDVMSEKDIDAANASFGNFTFQNHRSQVSL